MPDFDCIVLGAGIAGVTAARDLRAAGHQVLLLEGTARIGGRMRSVRDFVQHPGVDPARFPLEAGAEFIHVTLERKIIPQERHKPAKVIEGRYKEFWHELRRHDFKPRKLPKYGNFLVSGHNRIFFPGWAEPKAPIDAVFADNDLCAVKDIFDIVRGFKPGADPEPAGAFVDSRAFKGRGKLLARYTLSAHTPGVLKPGTDTISVHGLAADRIPDQLEDPHEYRLEDDDGRVVGYDALPAAIVREFEKPGSGLPGPPGIVRLNCVVERVARQSDGTMEVQARDANGTGLSAITARAVLSTFSVGVLHPVDGSGDAIFGALLTPGKRAALNVVRMGPITKFSLEFKERVWRTPKLTVLSNPTGQARTFFSSFPDRDDPPYILTGLLMSADHEWISSFADDVTAAEQLFREIEKVYNPAAGTPGGHWRLEDKLVGRVDAAGRFVPNFRRHEWSRNDPFTRGGNSFISVAPGAAVPVEMAREAIKSPLESLPLFWAGEGTAPAYHRDYQPLAVHGAYISGVEVARDIDFFLRSGAALFPAYYAQKYLSAPAAPAVISPSPSRAMNGERRGPRPLAPPRRRVDRQPRSPDGPKPLTAHLNVSRDELAYLKSYARLNKISGANKAAEDLLGTLLRLQVPSKPAKPRKTGKRPAKRSKGATEPVRVRLSGPLAERLTAYAGKAGDGKLDAVAEMMLRQLIVTHSRRVG